MNIALKPVNTLRDSYVDDLVDILNNDKKLIQELGGSVNGQTRTKLRFLQ